jgi:hypothetical protein
LAGPALDLGRQSTAFPQVTATIVLQERGVLVGVQGRGVYVAEVIAE